MFLFNSDGGLKESVELPKGSHPLVVYDVESGMALEALQGNMASFPLDLAYTCLFCVCAVTSVSF